MTHINPHNLEETVNNFTDKINSVAKTTVAKAKPKKGSK